MEFTERTFVNGDNAGNQIFLKVSMNDKGEMLTAKVSIKLLKEKYPRQMGTFNFLSRVFYCNRDSSKHYHYKTKGYAVNWTLLEDPMLAVEKIHMVIDDTLHYEFPKSVVNEYGKFLNFKEQGFELQRFVPYEIIKRYHVPTKQSPDDQQNGDKPAGDSPN